MTDDLISRSALLELYADTDEIKFDVYNVPVPVVRQNIIDMPAVDAVEVVRCKDCKHCSQNTPDGYHWCAEHERGLLEDDDFCSYGERRVDE